MRFFQEMLTSLMQSSHRFANLGRKHTPELSTEPAEAIDAVMSATGEVSSLLYAENLLNVLESLSDPELASVFVDILSKQDIDGAALALAAKHYQDAPNADTLGEISLLAEPAWLNLFRRLNATQHGTVRLVTLRKRLLALMTDNPALQRIDIGLVSLMRHWFNPGFLVLQPIDWSTPANILEKIIAYEAVHEIGSWDELRARLAPEDRRCFAFFHPAMPEEPLIFVEVALTATIPDRIDQLLDLARPDSDVDDAEVAVFYSISNCQAGLTGISFGNFLIKRVAQELQHEVEGLRQFVTLSPIPGFAKWVAKNAPETALTLANNTDREDDDIRTMLLGTAVLYFTASTRTDAMPNDPVARFHIGNGAILEQINYMGDRSKKGIEQSYGLMVNYRYDLDIVERNHEDFVKTKQVPLSPSVAALKKNLSA